MDGTQIVDHQGNLGFNTPGLSDYFKFGYYNWSGIELRLDAQGPAALAGHRGRSHGQQVQARRPRAYVNAR